VKIIKEFPFVKLNAGIATKLRDGYIWYEFYYSQGMSIYDKIKQPTMVMTALGAIAYFKLLPYWIFWILVPMWFIGWLVMGIILFDWFKIPQRKAVISGQKMSPWELEKMDRLERIEKWMKKK